MTVMDKKESNIQGWAMALSSIAIASIFAISMIKWPDYPKDGTWIGNLYYVSTASVLYIMSVLLFICANSFWWKVGSAFSMAVFGVNLYVELYLDPTNWTSWDLWLVIIVSFNTLLVVFITEKLKSKWRKPK